MVSSLHCHTEIQDSFIGKHGVLFVEKFGLRCSYPTVMSRPGFCLVDDKVAREPLPSYAEITRNRLLTISLDAAVDMG